MRFWKRRLLVLLAFAATCLLLKTILIHNSANTDQLNTNRRDELGYHEALSEERNYQRHPRSVVAMASDTVNSRQCSMGSCFDYSRCEDGFKVYVYPLAEDTKISPLYQKILKAIRNSRYYTTVPEEACILIPSLDTLDRDKLSKDFVHSLPQKLSELPYWNHGTNHLLFNLYSGTWPDYVENVDFDTGNAILAKASLSMNSYRPGFDVSLPLFPRNHAEKIGQAGAMETHKHTFPLKRPYLAAFKGKRYTFGKGGEVRNSLYHLNNNRDVVLLTTCRHGNDWTKYQDFRCKEDNEMYDKYEYNQLLINASYCLVPRGRRLGSFRFIEALQSSCVPVSLSNGYVLPFSEVIDWSRAAITVDERQLLQVVHMLRNLLEDQLLQMRLQTQFLWDTYFSSVESIVLTTLEILRQRVHPHLSSGRMAWNTRPGGLMIRPEFSTSLADFPFFHNPSERLFNQGFTAIIEVTGPPASTSLIKLIKSISQATQLKKIVLLSNGHQLESTQLPNIRAPIVVVRGTKSDDDNNPVTDSWPLDQLATDGILSLGDDIILHPEEADFGFDVWQHHPDRVVGFLSHSHRWDDHKSRWTYSNAPENRYSIVLTKPAFFHKYYAYMFEHMMPQLAKELITQTRNCKGLGMNFLVSSVTKKAPLKLINRNMKQFTSNFNSQRQVCTNAFTSIFGEMPLRYSMMRMDPSLFKDNVSVLRKQYRKLETL